MNYISDYIKRESREVLGITVNISEKQKSFKEMEKSIFVECIDTLKELDDRSSFLIEEMGINTVNYEDKFYKVIENLLKLTYNEGQLELIQTYLHKEEDVVEVTLRIGKEDKDFKFETTTDLYKIVKVLENE